jgi:DNA polymerase IV
MADDVWDWCEKTGRRGRTVTVKIKWSDFQQSTRSQSVPRAIDSRARLQNVSLDLVRSVFPPARGVRLVGVTLSNFARGEDPTHAALSLLPDADGLQPA